MKCLKVNLFDGTSSKILILTILFLQIHSTLHLKHVLKFQNRPIKSITNHHLQLTNFNKDQIKLNQTKKLQIIPIQIKTEHQIRFSHTKSKFRIQTEISQQFLTVKQNKSQKQTAQQSCNSWIKYSIPSKQKIQTKNDCNCRNGTFVHQTKTGQKCLELQPIGYPQLADLTCGFFAFLIPSIVAYLCRHQQEVEKHKLYLHALRKHNFLNHKNQNDEKQTPQSVSQNNDKKAIQQTLVKNKVKNKFTESHNFMSSKIQNLSDNYHVENSRLYSSTISRLPKYACATQSFDEKLTKSLKYGYASAKDISLIKNQFS